MKALLLAAGFGTRLRPITDKVPKCLVPIQGKPLLGYWLDMLSTQGINQILINTHYLPEAVKSFVQSHPLQEKIILIHETELLGTAGTVLKNRTWLQEGPFLLAHADNLTRFNLPAFIDAHARRELGIEITMMTFETDSPQNCGIVECNENDVVIGFHEKVPNPPSNQANAAVYIIEPSVIAFLASLNKEVIDFSTEVIPHYMARIQMFRNTEYHRDIGTPESLRLAEIEFISDVHI